MDTTPIFLEVEDKGDYLLFHACGFRTLAVVMEMAKEVSRRTQAAGKRKILLNARDLTGELRVIDDYLLVTKTFEEMRGSGINKAAILDRSKPQAPEWFIETVAQNRGFNFRVFDDEQAAIQWLEG